MERETDHQLWLQDQSHLRRAGAFPCGLLMCNVSVLCCLPQSPKSRRFLWVLWCFRRNQLLPWFVVKLCTELQTPRHLWEHHRLKDDSQKLRLQGLVFHWLHRSVSLYYLFQPNRTNYEAGQAVPSSASHQAYWHLKVQQVSEILDEQLIKRRENCCPVHDAVCLQNL